MCITNKLGILECSRIFGVTTCDTRLESMIDMHCADDLYIFVVLLLSLLAEEG